jgi:hypothetical protein
MEDKCRTYTVKCYSIVLNSNLNPVKNNITLLKYLQKNNDLGIP